MVRDVVAVLNLRLRGDGSNVLSPVNGDVSHMPFGSKETHDPPDRWLRAKSLHLIMSEMIEMKV
ncbi:hypothetical protein D1868_03500 [Stygiolobus azoricus]|uniref:Uncharacterized protein n=1 Tax=Stygiolobus azoricus TaxID=41675 RepID=A0A650CN90_9CREN|nr:hypothetical protein [Stygiolobus azoricus]QGR19132.1 hypothetical protein D1868_03500 [Stygiolobus azoricus]